MMSETLRLVVGVVDHRESCCDDRVWDDEDPEVAAVRDRLCERTYVFQEELELGGIGPDALFWRQSVILAGRDACGQSADADNRSAGGLLHAL